MESLTENGETPLMLAALMGHVEIVAILCQHEASLSTTNEYGRNALYYTTGDVTNDLRRDSYSEYFTEKDPEGAKLRRQLIAAALQSSSKPSPPVHPEKIQTSEPLIFIRHERRIEMFQRIADVTIPRARAVTKDNQSGDTQKSKITKAFASIKASGELHPRACAVSGWSEDLSRYPNLIDGLRWTRLTLKVAHALGFHFKSHRLDMGGEAGKVDEDKVGRYFASHAEVKLATWYCLELLSAHNLTPQASRTFLTANLIDLSRVDLGHARCARIDMIKPPCESCGLFLLALSKRTGITFEVNHGDSAQRIPHEIVNRSIRLWEAVDETEVLDEGSEAGWRTKRNNNNATNVSTDVDSDGEDSTMSGLEGDEPEVDEPENPPTPETQTPCMLLGTPMMSPSRRRRSSSDASSVTIAGSSELEVKASRRDKRRRGLEANTAGSERSEIRNLREVLEGCIYTPPNSHSKLRPSKAEIQSNLTARSSEAPNLEQSTSPRSMAAFLDNNLRLLSSPDPDLEEVIPNKACKKHDVTRIRGARTSFSAVLMTFGHTPEIPQPETQEELPYTDWSFAAPGSLSDSSSYGQL